MANQADIRNLSFDKVTSVLCGSFSPIAFPFFIYIITLRLGLLEIITLRAFKIPFHQRKHQPRSLSCADGGKKVEPDTSGRHLTGVFRIKLSYLGNSISQNNSFCECFLVSRLCCIVTSKSFPVNAVELDGTPQTLSSHSLELEKEEGRTQPGPAACAPWACWRLPSAISKVLEGSIYLEQSPTWPKMGSRPGAEQQPDFLLVTRTSHLN